jgi:hypothetical protein
MPNPNDLSAPGNKRRRKTISKSEAMKAEYDFSKAERGKFYHPGADFSFPIYFDPDVNEFLSILAKQKQVDVQDLVNEWLRVNMRQIKSTR